MRSTGKWVVVHDDDETVLWSAEAAKRTAEYWTNAGAQVLVYEEMFEDGAVWMQGVMW